MTALALPSARPETSQATQDEQSRAIAEVQAAVVVAQQCPRDMARAARSSASSRRSINSWMALLMIFCVLPIRAGD